MESVSCANTRYESFCDILERDTVITDHTVSCLLFSGNAFDSVLRLGEHW